MEFSQQSEAYTSNSSAHEEALKYNQIFDIIKPEIETTLSKFGVSEPTLERLKETHPSPSIEFIATLHSFKLLFGKHPLGIDLDYNEKGYSSRGTSYIKEGTSLLPEILTENTEDESLAIFAKKEISKNALAEINTKDKARKYTYSDMRGDALELHEKAELFYSLLNGPKANSNAEKNVEKNLSSIRHYYVTELALAGRSAEIINLLRTGRVESGSVHGSYGVLDQDSLIQVLKIHPGRGDTVKGYEVSRVLDGMKQITDAGAMQEIFVKNIAKNFSYLDERDRERVLKCAKNLSEALNSEPVISELASLSMEGPNKFIMGVQTDSEGSKIFVTWSSQQANDRHKHQLRKHTELAKVNVDAYSVSGGYIEINQNESGKLELVFNSSSGDYGKYSKRTLEKFSAELTAELSKCLGDKEVILTIE